MKQKCIELLNSVAGRMLRPEELHGLETSLKKAYGKLASENMEAFQSLSYAEKFQKARDRVIADLHDSTARSFENDLRSKAHLENFKQNIERANSGERMQAIADHIYHKAGSMGTSLEHEISSDTGRMLSDVQSIIKGYGETHWGFMQDPLKHEVFIRELFGEHTGDKHAREIAQAFKGVSDTAHQRAERSGIGYEKKDHYIPQPVNPDKVLMLGEEAFVSELRDALDGNQYFHLDGTPYTQKDIDALLKSSFKTLAHSGQNKAFDNPKQKFSQFTPLSSLTKERQLHFKDADSYLKYMDLVGEKGSPIELLTQSYRNIARRTVIAEKFGKDPDTFVRNLIEQSMVADRKAIDADPKRVGKDFEGKDKKGKALKDLDRKKEEVLGIWDVILNGENVGNILWAQRWASIRGVLSIQKLGTHLFASVVEDTQMLAMGIKKNGLNKAEVHSFLGKGVVGSNKELIQNASLFAESVSSSARRFMEDTHSPAFMRHGNELLSKLSGVHTLDRGMKEAIQLPVLNAIGRRTKQYASLEQFRASEGKANAGIFEHGGFTQDHWEVARLAGRDSGPDGIYSLINDRHIQDIDPKKLISLIENKKVRSGILESKKAFKAKISEMIKRKESPEKIKAYEARRDSLLLREAQILKDETSKKIYAILQKEAQTWARGAMGASLLDKSRMGLLKNPAGTLGGELLRFILQFKLTPISIARSILFDLPSAGSNFKKLGIPLTSSEMRSRWIATAMVASVVASTLKSLSQFEEPVFDQSMALKAIANIIPVYMDFILHEEGQSTSAGALMSRMAGPGFNSLFEMASVVHGMQAGEKVSERLKRLGLNSLPFNNLFYLKGLKDLAIKKKALKSSRRKY